MGNTFKTTSVFRILQLRLRGIGLFCMSFYNGNECAVGLRRDAPHPNFRGCKKTLRRESFLHSFYQLFAL